MARRRGNSKKYGSETNWLAIIGSVVLVAAVAGLAMVSAFNETNTFNEDTLCLEGKPHPAVLGVIIDTLTHFPLHQQQKRIKK